MKSIAVIGGGAAGLAAAVAAARELRRTGEDAAVTVFEAGDRLGKPILATGNGRCNFSNAAVSAERYYNKEFVSEAFGALPPQEVWGFFADLGLLWREEGEGRLYPQTGKASSVLDVLRFALHDLGIREQCEKEATMVAPVGRQFLVCFESEETAYFDAVVLACGARATRSMLPPAYPFQNTRPMLGPLETETGRIAGLNNIRVRCRIECAGAYEAGELLFRDYGVSGIVAFDLSRFALPGDDLDIDLLPQLEERELLGLLRRRREEWASRTAVGLCAGMLLPAVARAVLKGAGIKPDAPLAEEELPLFARSLKHFGLKVKGIGDVRQCQVSRGGFEVDSFEGCTMESKAHPGLFVAGEALDVDAPCGGYNLHWAWASGILAGRSAVLRLSSGDA